VSNDNVEKYRLLVSDGQYLHSFAMLATQLNELYTSDQLKDFTIIRVNRYMSSMITRNERGEK
jgi:replication factor A1